MDHCPDCGRPYGKRKRCYYCNGKPKVGLTLNCEQCGKEFYRQKNQLERYGGKFCSYECKYEWYRGRKSPLRQEDKKVEHPGGYWLVWVGHDHPASQSGRILEHRHVMEQYLGRYLEPGEVVHHINGDKKDNRLENLQLMTDLEHKQLHGERIKPKLVTLICQECGEPFEVKPSRANAKNPKDMRKHCSRACDDKARSRRMKAYWAEKRKQGD